MGLNLFFDVDYTILGLDDTLRPGTKEVFQRLKEDGHDIYIWSGNGIRWREVRMHNLEPFVTDCFEKPLSNFEAQMQASGIPVRPDLVVDDYPEIANALGGIWIRPYLYKRVSDGDQEMERVYEIICAYARDGHSDDHRFRPRINDAPAP